MASRSSNKTAVPEAKGAMNKFKYEVASELGVPLTDSRRSRWQKSNRRRKIVCRSGLHQTEKRFKNCHVQ